MRTPAKNLFFLLSGTGLAITMAASAAAQTASGSTGAPIATPTKGGAAADQAGATTNDITVIGVRASLRGAQAIKRKAVQVVDSIVAEDIGKLPDNTVSDAVQRVTGIQVTRASGEATSVQLRGLPDIETYINGRETFTGTGRGVQLADIPAELVAGIDTYKTQSPDQVEGAIAGAIDIRLRRPFDFQGLRVAGGARGIYGDQSKKGSYIGSGLVSNHWTNSAGQEFGILIGGSYNRRRYEDQTGFNFGFNPFTNAATGNQPLLIPDTVGGLVTDGDRKRIGGNISLQWKPSADLEIYADGLFTGYRNDYSVDFFVGLPKAGNVVATTAQAGSAGSETGSPVASSITTQNNFTISSKQAFKQKTDNYQGDIGLRWTPGRATISTEFTYNDSKVFNQQFVLDTAYVVPSITYNFNANGTPNVNFNGFNYRDGSVLNLLTLFDNANSASSKQYAWRGDLAFDVGSGFIRTFKAGWRYSDRSGNSGGTNGSGFPLGFLPGSQFPGLVSHAPNGIIDGLLGVDGFALADTSFIRNNIVQLRQIAGIPASGRAYDPALTFGLKEQTYAGYAEAGYGLDLGSVPITGVFGARLVNTVTGLMATQVDTHAVANPAPGAPATITTLTPINTHSSDFRVLPSFTIKAQLQPDIVARLIGSKSIFRPQFAQLDPATSLTQLGITGGAIGTGSGGNANLQVVRADNLDMTFEWYFSNTGSITIGGFYKKLNGYIQTYAAPETFVGSGGQNQTYLVSRPRNSGTGELKGIEVGYQQFFDFLPGALSGFGAQANFTLADGHVQSPPDANGMTTQQAIVLTSKYSYNLVGIYEKYGFSARLAYNWRSKYVDSYSSTYPPYNSDGRIVVQPLAFLDFSASYALNDKITLTFDATNLLDRRYHDNFGSSAYEPRDTRQYDRTFGGGVRFKF